MAIAATAFAPPPPMDPTDKQKYRTRLASAGVATNSPRTKAMNLHVNVGAHNLRILKKAGTSVDTPRTSGSSTSATPTPTSASKQRKYERKSKRFLWPDELHRLFVAAIFDIGLKNASPKALLSIMSSAGASSDLTTEHLKSHLQKYRLNYERSRLEFLEFYDESARRSHKRHRKSVSRSSSSDHNNTAFVFPISHKRQRSGRDGSSDDDSGSDVTSDMEEDGSSASLAESPHQADQPEATRRRSSPSPVAKTPVATEPQVSEPPTPTYAAPIQPYQTAMSLKTKATNDNVVDGISDRMVAAAAAAAVASVPFAGGLNTLNDPQWNILNSLISPQLAASRGPGESATDAAAGATLVGAAKLPGGFEPFSLGSVESADLQMQMHLAMQAQMNLHRQMLTRKVEVSQHIHNQQQQQGQASSAASKPPASQADSAWNTAVVSNANTAVTLASKSPSMATDLPSSRLLGSLLGGDATATTSFASTASSSAFSQALSTSTAAAAPSTVESWVSSTLLGLQGGEFADAAALASLEAVGPSDKMDEGESLTELYRWDKMDFTMDLDDDDLFGFLKS